MYLVFIPEIAFTLGYKWWLLRHILNIFHCKKTAYYHQQYCYDEYHELFKVRGFVLLKKTYSCPKTDYKEYTCHKWAY
jgi:hypothetical protein